MVYQVIGRRFDSSGYTEPLKPYKSAQQKALEWYKVELRPLPWVSLAASGWNALFDTGLMTSLVHSVTSATR